MLAITAAGAGFRLYKIGDQPLWLDEAFSVWMAQHSISDIVKITIDIDQHPPFYHMLLHFWMALGGDGERWVRLLSALFGFLTIIVIFYLGKTISGPLVGLLAALALAFSPFHVQYGQEARSYALLALCATASIWMMARLLLDCRARPRPSTWLGYMLFSALALLTHNTAIFLPLGTNLFVFSLMIYRGYRPAEEGQVHAPSLRGWLLAQVGMALLWSPWLPGFFAQSMGVAEEFWLQPPTVDSVMEALKTFLMAHLPDQIRWQTAVWAGFAGAFALALVRFRERAGHFLFLAALFLTPLLVELLVSLVRPIFYDRTLIWSTIPLYVLFAAGVRQLRYKPYIVTAVIIFATLSLLSMGNFFRNYEKERWDLAAAYVSDQIQEGDILIFNSNWAQIPFDYYFRPDNRAVEKFGAPQTMFEGGELEPRMTESDVSRLRSIIRGRSRVWLVYSHNWWTDPDALIEKTLKSELRLLEMKNFNGMQIQLYGAK